MTTGKLFNHKSLVEHIAEHLEEKIISGALKPGQRIIEESLTQAFGVSRSPVREAFRILEIQGFVTREPRKGISVARVSPQEVEETYLIRANIESLAVRLAIQKQNPEILQQLKTLQGRMADAAASHDLQQYYHLNFQFHETFTNGCENKRLVKLVETFSKQTRCHRLMLVSRQDLMSMPGWMQASLKNHGKLIQAFEDRNRESGERIRKKQILDNIARIVKMLGSEENGASHAPKEDHYRNTNASVAAFHPEL